MRHSYTRTTRSWLSLLSALADTIETAILATSSGTNVQTVPFKTINANQVDGTLVVMRYVDDLFDCSPDLTADSVVDGPLLPKILRSTGF